MERNSLSLGDRYRANIERAPTGHGLTPEEREMRAAKKDLDQALESLTRKRSSIAEQEARLTGIQDRVRVAASRYEAARQAVLGEEAEAPPARPESSIWRRLFRGI